MKETRTNMKHDMCLCRKKAIIKIVITTSKVDKIKFSDKCENDDNANSIYCRLSKSDIPTYLLVKQTNMFRIYHPITSLSLPFNFFRY